jgi:hypothetical protein
MKRKAWISHPPPMSKASTKRSPCADGDKKGHCGGDALNRNLLVKAVGAVEKLLRTQQPDNLHPRQGLKKPSARHSRCLVRSASTSARRC